MAHIDDAKFDELLVAALYRASELDSADMPSGGEFDKAIQPSLRFRRRMNALVKNPKRYIRNQNRSVLFRSMRAAAVILITFAILLGSAMAVSPTVRATVVNLVRSWLYDRTVYQVPETDISHSWTFGYLPDGFVMIAKQEDEMASMRVYQRDDSSFITITITSGRLVVDNEHSDHFQTIINGRITNVYASNDPKYPSIIVIFDDVSEILITIASNLDITEVLHIAENIK